MSSSDFNHVPKPTVNFPRPKCGSDRKKWDTNMTYGIIFVSALAAMIVAVAVVETHPPGQAGVPGGWSQDTTDNGKAIVEHAVR
jgi:hypothetical protein